MTTQRAPRASRISRQFRSEGSEELTARTTPNATHVVFTVGNGKALDVDLASFFGGTLPPAGVGRALTAFGLSQTVGNAGLTGVDEEDRDDPDEIYSALSERIKSLQAGRWTAEHRGGGRPSRVLQALVELRKRNGRPIDEASMAPFVEKIQDPDYVKSLHANSKFEEIFLELKNAKVTVTAVGDADLMA